MTNSFNKIYQDSIQKPTAPPPVVVGNSINEYISDDIGVLGVVNKF